MTDPVYARLGGDAQWFRHVLYGLAGETSEAQEALDKWEAAHAHELAERIRAEFADAYDAAQEVLSGSDAMAAADHIDPEVTS